MDTLEHILNAHSKSLQALAKDARLSSAETHAFLHPAAPKNPEARQLALLQLSQLFAQGPQDPEHAAALTALAEQLLQADDAQLSLLHVLMHELRSPLVTLRGYVEMMLRGALGPTTPLQVQSMQVALRNAFSLEDSIDIALNHARLSRQRCPLHRQPTSLQRTLERATRFFDALAERKKILFTVLHDDREDLLISADPEHLTLILRILLDNAVKFTHEGQVTLRVSSPQKNLLRFEILDTGVGIPHEHQHDIFLPFTKLDPHGKGAGLGLTVAQGLVQLHGAALHLQAQNPQGSLFWFELPQA